MFLSNCIHTRLFGVSAEGDSFIAFLIENEVVKWGGGGVCNSSFGNMIFHTTFYRSNISFSHDQDFNSEYLHFLTTLVIIFGLVNY